MLNRQGRPTVAEKNDGGSDIKTFTGNRGLQINEPLLFEVGSRENCGVDFPQTPKHKNCLGAMARDKDIGLAGLSEPETMRHYVRLSQKNYSIDTGFYPLGSCTMKHNPRLNEKMARLPGFGNIHPLQPQKTVQGAFELMGELSHWLMTLTNTQAVALSPKAGAHGELCGMMAIKAAHEAAGSKRNIVLVPDSAHGTNPATAALIGYKVRSIPASDDGSVSVESVLEVLDDDVAALMLTNPNTGGVFEKDIKKIADAIHEAGAYFYCDGANLNALMGRVRPGDLGIDAMHINLHKTFSTPHGGGGPGAGPVVFSKRLAAYAPLPYLVKDGDSWQMVETRDAVSGNAKPFGRMVAFHGQMGMFTRALTYMMSHGTDGLRQACTDAVINANYLRASLQDLMSLPFGERNCMHEVLFDDSFLKDTDVTTLDFAKAMIDEGFHPMTIYFPLVVHGAMLMEPTETESRAALDEFIATVRNLVKRAKSGEVDYFKNAPVLAPRRRMDETKAARKPVLRWSEGMEG